MHRCMSHLCWLLTLLLKMQVRRSSLQLEKLTLELCQLQIAAVTQEHRGTRDARQTIEEALKVLPFSEIRLLPF